MQSKRRRELKIRVQRLLKNIADIKVLIKRRSELNILLRELTNLKINDGLFTHQQNKLHQKLLGD